MRPRPPPATAFRPLGRRFVPTRIPCRLDPERSSTVRPGSRPGPPVAICRVGVADGALGGTSAPGAGDPELVAVHPVVVREERADRFDDERVDVAKGPYRGVSAGCVGDR